MFILILMLVLISACGKKKSENKNMEQILSEQGIPIRVTEIQPGNFVQQLKYNSSLTGIEESVVKSLLADVVLSVKVKVGDRVSKGQVLVSFPQNSPAAQYEQAKTAYESTKQSYERMQRLFQDGAISRQDMDNMETAYKVSQANLDASRQMVNITAPISGIVTNVMVNPGEHVFPGHELLKVANTSRYKAIVWVPDTEISKVRIGQKAVATWNEHKLTGRVSQIALALDQQNKAFRVELEFPNSNREIKAGVTVELDIQISNKANCLIVQRSHILQEADQKYVWILDGDKALKREISTGLDNQLEYEVLSGLSSGDKLITQGLNMITEGAKVKVIENNHI